jgi:hypothetical protein
MKDTSPFHAAAPSKSHRRAFVRTLLTGTGAVAAMPSMLRGAENAGKPSTASDQFHEPDRNLPLHREADVIV